MKKLLLIVGLMAGLAACTPTGGCCDDSGGGGGGIAATEVVIDGPISTPVAYTATGDEAANLSDLGATTNPDGSVTVYEADMTGSAPGGL